MKFTIALLIILFFSCDGGDDGVTKIIELDQFVAIVDSKYSNRVLIANPPKDTDSLKKLMINYFKEKSIYVDSVYPNCYFSGVFFYRKTCETAYFIDNEEDGSGFSSHLLLEEYHERIGGVFAHRPCENASAKWFKKILLYEKTKNKTDIHEISCDTVYFTTSEKLK